MIRLGRYELIEELGRGGMGAVYRAHHPDMGRDVAIKVLLAGDGATDRQRERFRTEVRTAARLRHPNIVAVHDVGESDGRLYLVMDMIEGQSLDRRIHEGPPLGTSEAVALAETLARALHYAHGCSVIHRDVKPANVLLTPKGEPLLTDFGLAKDALAESGITVSGQFLGTATHAAPEQATGERAKVGPASDVYSLGVTLYQMLTGELPILAETRVEHMRALMEDRPSPPSTLKAGLDPALDAVCMKCLEKDPAARYPTAEALADDLRHVLECEPLAGAPAPARKGKRTLALVAAGALISIGVGLPLVLDGDPPSPPPPPPSPAEALEELLSRSAAQRNAGDYQAALLTVEEAVRLAPRHPAALNDRGVVRDRLGDLAGAESDFTRAIEADPRHEVSYVNRASIRWRLEKYAASRSDYDRALEIDPRDPHAWAGRGLLRGSTGDRPGALSDFAQALELDPRQTVALTNRADIYWAEGKLDLALRDADLAIETDPGRAMAFNTRANIRYSLENYAGAVEDYSRAIELDPDLAMAWSNRGNARVALGQLDQGLADFTHATEQLGFLLALYLRGANRPDREGAIADLEAFLKRAPPASPYANMARTKLDELRR